MVTGQRWKGQIFEAGPGRMSDWLSVILRRRSVTEPIHALKTEVLLSYSCSGARERRDGDVAQREGIG